MTAVLDALAAQVGRTGALLEQLSDEQWRAPTRCEPLTVLELAAHMLRGADRAQGMLAAGPQDGEAEKDAATYFGYDPGDVGGGVVRRAQNDAAGRTGPELAKDWMVHWASAIEAARAVLTRDDILVASIFGRMRLTGYLKTRVVEVTIHTMDVEDALGRDPNPDPAALTVTADVLRLILGTDMRASGTDDVRFVLVGSGRAPLDATERAALGPLADRFPLLA